MKIPNSIVWAQTIEEATAVQQELRHLVIQEDKLGEVRYVAGVDVGFQDNYAITQAAVAVLSFPDLQLVESAIATLPTTFPTSPVFSLSEKSRQF